MNRPSLTSIRLLILDVDGVLTEGGIHLGPDGTEHITFHVHDGFGLRQLLKNGIEVAVITGRDVPAVKLRCRDLGIRHVYTGISDKEPIYRELLAKLSLQDDQVCFVGDDVPDIGPMMCAGYAITVPGARAEVRAIAHHVTDQHGGKGAVRDVCELILRAHGLWDQVIESHRGSSTPAAKSR